MKSRRAKQILIAVAGLLSTAWGPGGTGTNGLLATYYQGQRNTFTDSVMKQALPASNPTVPNRIAGFTGPAMGKRNGVVLVHDAFGCALPHTASRTWGTETFVGQDLMNLGDSWLNGPLAADQMDDVHTCLVARLNKFGVEVPIFLFGPHVRPVFASYTKYVYAEAVWLATTGDPTNVTTDVWPLDDLKVMCGQDVSKIAEAIALRVCGGATAQCGVTVHSEPMAQRCDASPTGWSCSPSGAGPKRPAVATRLGPCAWSKIYAESRCQMPQPPPSTACAHGEP
ncbi:MAG: hypothetical protein U0359_13545 [Byssovorax sp.]